jgi:hypothetical protein
MQMPNSNLFESEKRHRNGEGQVHEQGSTITGLSERITMNDDSGVMIAINETDTWSHCSSVNGRWQGPRIDGVEDYLVTLQIVNVLDGSEVMHINN